jgi:hypothetical protein
MTRNSVEEKLVQMGWNTFRGSVQTFLPSPKVRVPRIEDTRKMNLLVLTLFMAHVIESEKSVR